MIDRISASVVGILAAVLVTALGGPASAKPLVHPKPGAHASLTPTGPWLAHPAPDNAGDQRSITELEDERGKRVRITTYLTDGSLEVYLDPAGLDTLTTVDVELHVSAAATALTDHDAGAKVGRGVPVADAVAERGGLTRVKVHSVWGDSTLDVHGFVPTTSLGTHYDGGVFDASAPRPPRPSPPDHELPASFDLLAAPGGKVFASRHGKTAPAVTVVITSGAFSLVRLDPHVDGLVLTGWIATNRVNKLAARPDDRTAGLFSGGGGHGPVELYDARGGHVIGTLWDPSQEKPVAEIDGWVRYDLATEFGIATVWARP